MTSQEPSLSPQGGIQSALGFTAVCFVLLCIVIGVTLAASSMSKPGENQGAIHVATFSGKDNGTTPSFTVKKNWEFRWEHDGKFEQIIWHRSDGFKDLLMEMPRKPIREHGSLNYSEGGEYSFEFIGTGNWTVKIYQF